jgi:hypothetical protein
MGIWIENSFQSYRLLQKIDIVLWPYQQPFTQQLGVHHGAKIFGRSGVAAWHDAVGGGGGKG